jgi:hypothetical protein
MPNSLDAIMTELTGQRCEQVDNPHGSILRLDLGEMSVPAAYPAGAQPHGWRHVTVLSPWRLADGERVICDWTDPGGAGGVLTDLIQVLKGQLVVAASSSPPSFDLRLQFGGGHQLTVFADVDDSRSDAWFVLGTDGTEIGVSPQRADEGGLTVRPSPAA